MGQVSRYNFNEINFPCKRSLLEPHSSGSTDLIQGQKLIIERMEFEGKLHFDSKFLENLVRDRFMYPIFAGERPVTLLPFPSKSVFLSPIYVSPIRIASNCGDSFRTCVQIRCPLHRESYLTGWSISFRFNPWNAIHHSWDSPREKKLICHETHGFSFHTHVH